MTTAQSYKAKKYAMRAAARALQTPQNLREVEKVADLYEDEGRWFWKKRNVSIVNTPVEAKEIEEPKEVKKVLTKLKEVAKPEPKEVSKVAPPAKKEQAPQKEEKEWPPRSVVVNGKRFDLTDKDRERMLGGTPSKSGFLYSRPKAGTKGAEIWSWCDKLGAHKAVQEMGKINGHNPTSVSGVYSNWIHRDE